MSQMTNEPGSLPLAEAVSLPALVAYQDGTIVSRTLAKTGGGSLTLFAFAAGQSLSEHTAPFDAIVAVLDGEMTLVIGGKTVVAKLGETVRMPAGVPHAVNAPGRCKMLLTMLRA